MNGAGAPAAADVLIMAECSRSIPAQSTILASVSPVFESLLAAATSSPAVIRIPGVPYNALKVFVEMLHSLDDDDEGGGDLFGEYGVYVLVLSHVYAVGRLKRAAEEAMAARLAAGTVADALQLARRCDAPRLRLRCMAMLREDFPAVERTEGWRFLQAHDPWLELDVLQALHDSDLRAKRRRRRREQQRVFVQLSDAMECLHHIFTDGCAGMGPSSGGGTKQGSRCCPIPETCRGVQLLIYHFAACPRKRACQRCRRMWQLLRLHSSVCDGDPCRVSFCQEFKRRDEEQLQKQLQRGEVGKVGRGRRRWEMLVKRVVEAKVGSTIARRKKQEVSLDSWLRESSHFFFLGFR